MLADWLPWLIGAVLVLEVLNLRYRGPASWQRFGAIAGGDVPPSFAGRSVRVSWRGLRPGGRHRGGPARLTIGDEGMLVQPSLMGRDAHVYVRWEDLEDWEDVRAGGRLGKLGTRGSRCMVAGEAQLELNNPGADVVYGAWRSHRVRTRGIVL